MKIIDGIEVLDKLDEIVNPKHTAIIVVDMQNDFCSKGGYYDKIGVDVSPFQGMLPKLITLLDEARKRSVLIVFIQNTNLRNHLSGSPAWLAYMQRICKGTSYTIEGTWGQEIMKELKRRDDEPIVKKHRSSGFFNTDLDMILRSRGIKSVIITGMSTPGCVESTLRDAAFRDYYVVELSDCVAAEIKEYHDASLRAMKRGYALITESAEIVKIWREGELLKRVEVRKRT